MTVFLPHGDKCRSNPKFKYVIAYRFICDLNSLNPLVNNANKFDPESCFNIIEIKTDLVCGQDLVHFSTWYSLLNINRQIIAVFFSAIGFFLTLFSDLHRLKSFLGCIGLSTIYLFKFFISEVNYVIFIGKVNNDSFNVKKT